MILSEEKITHFRKIIYDHYKKSGRHTLPWRTHITPYRVYISEIMLQQTQVDRVIKKFTSFISAFPDFKSINRAPLADLLAAWQGLGYNRRVIHLKKAAALIAEEFKGLLPDDPDILETLPGIGKATAASISAFAFDNPVVFVETNIRSIFIHHFFARNKKVRDETLIPLIAQTLDKKHPARWYSALMDYGTSLKQRVANPSRRSNSHVVQSKFEGSDRQLRGAVLRELLALEKATIHVLAKNLAQPAQRIQLIASSLIREGFLHKSGTALVLNK